MKISAAEENGAGTEALAAGTRAVPALLWRTLMIGIAPRATDLHHRARVAVRCGDLHEAVVLYEEALSLRRSVSEDDEDWGRVWRNGALWEIEFVGRKVNVRNTKGVEYVARLLAVPGHPVPAPLLVGGREGLGKLADGLARLRELRADLEVAEEAHDHGRCRALACELERELERLAVHTAKPNRSPTSERARVRATQAIRSAIQRIERHHPLLGAHLIATIRTGARCGYMAEPVRAIRWDVRL